MTCSCLGHDHIWLPLYWSCKYGNLDDCINCMQALAPFTIGRSQVTASLLGALWGFGHSAGQLFMGLLMIILKVSTNLLTQWKQR